MIGWMRLVDDVPVYTCIYGPITGRICILSILLVPTSCEVYKWGLVWFVVKVIKLEFCDVCAMSTHHQGSFSPVS